jgi:FkbM family methyltransferase
VSATSTLRSDASADIGAARAALANARSAEDLIAYVKTHNSGFDPYSLGTIAIVGAGPEGKRLAEICGRRGQKIAALVDDDPEKVETSIGGIAVEPTKRLQDLKRATPIIIASHRVLEPIERLRALGFSTVLPFAALQITAPHIFKPHMFYEGWLEDLLENREQYRWLGSELADERSRQVLEAVMQFRLTIDPVSLVPVLEEGPYYRGLYHPTGLFDLGESEVYVDACSYDGDSIRRFIERVGGRYERILAFEPDPTTFGSLKQNFANEPRVQTFNAGLHRHKGVLRFRDDSTRGAIFTDDGDNSIEVVSLDEVLAGSPASYIKMNIEGAEIDALLGARGTIQRWMPKLAISAYHRPSDLWHIPRLVKEFSTAYDIYLRQHDGGVIETVLYAIPHPPS